MTVIHKAETIDGGLDGFTRGKMGFNVGVGLLIGVTPALGDIADGFWQANTRNAAAFEKFLVDRRAVRLKAADKEMLEVEKTGRASSRNRAASRNRTQSDRYNDSEAVTRSRRYAQTDGYYDHEPAPPRRDHTQVNGYHNSDPAPALPSRVFDERHGGVHERLGIKPESVSRASNPSGGSWFSGRKSRKGDGVAPGTNGARDRKMAQVDDLAPARPPRPDNARQQNVGNF